MKPVVSSYTCDKCSKPVVIFGKMMACSCTSWDSTARGPNRHQRRRIAKEEAAKSGRPLATAMKIENWRVDTAKLQIEHAQQRTFEEAQLPPKNRLS
jgi:hypothetical protein